MQKGDTSKSLSRTVISSDVLTDSLFSYLLVSLPLPISLMELFPTFVLVSHNSKSKRRKRTRLCELLEVRHSLETLSLPKLSKLSSLNGLASLSLR